MALRGCGEGLSSWAPGPMMRPGWCPARLRSRLVAWGRQLSRGPAGLCRAGAVCPRGRSGLRSPCGHWKPCPSPGTPAWRPGSLREACAGSEGLVCLILGLPAFSCPSETAPWLLPSPAQSGRPGLSTGQSLSEPSGRGLPATWLQRTPLPRPPAHLPFWCLQPQCLPSEAVANRG